MASHFPPRFTLVMDENAYKLADQDEDEKAEKQGHPGRPDLNREMFTPSIRNMVSISAFGQRYTVRKRPWDDVTPINLLDLLELDIEADPSTSAEAVRKVVEETRDYKKIPVS